MALTRPREAALLEAATRLFRERGFHATSMQDLAEALGMNRGSLYHYIDSKDDLLWTIVSDALARLESSAGAELTAEAPGAARLRRAIRAHLRTAADEPDPLSLLQVEVRSLTPARREELLDRRDAYEALWRRAVADAIEEGEFRAVDVRLATITVLSACNWFTQWYRPGGPLSVDEIAESMTELLLAGLEAGGSGDDARPAGAKETR